MNRSDFLRRLAACFGVGLVADKLDLIEPYGQTDTGGTCVMTVQVPNDLASGWSAMQSTITLERIDLS